MNGRRALVTGASRGIGAAIAARFREAGAEVLTPSRSELDLLSNESIRAYLAALREPVEIVVNNAGINPLAGSTEVRDRDLHQVLQVNLVAPIHLIAGVVPGMKARHYGRIVNISSIFGGAVAKERRLAYSASKAAIVGLTKALAVELASSEILVNAVAPGYVNTELTRQNNSPRDLELIQQTIPLQRLAEAEEIAEVVAFLCSRKNSYITGQTLFVDGGFTCR